MHKLYKYTRCAFTYCFLAFYRLFIECVRNKTTSLSKTKITQVHCDAIFLVAVSTTELLWLH